MRRHVIAISIGAVLLGAAAFAAFLLRTTLNRTAGEDPSVSAACPSVADARWDGVTMRVGLNNMDPARFPAGCSATEVKVGGIDVRGIALAAVPSEGCLPIVPTTTYVFKKAGVVTAGTKVELRIQCVDAAGLRHQTQYAGTF